MTMSITFVVVLILWQCSCALTRDEKENSSTFDKDNSVLLPTVYVKATNGSYDDDCGRLHSPCGVSSDIFFVAVGTLWVFSTHVC